MRRALMLGALLALALAGRAQAVTLVNPDGTPSPYQLWADAYPVPTPDATLTISPDASGCSPSPGCTSAGNTIWLDARVAGRDDPQYAQFALAHEIGHQFDFRVLTEGDRAAYLALTTFAAATPWFGCHPGDRTACERSPAESFADAYAACALPPSVPRYYEVNLTAAEGDAACAVIRRAVADNQAQQAQLAAAYAAYLGSQQALASVPPSAPSMSMHHPRRRHHRHHRSSRRQHRRRHIG